MPIETPHFRVPLQLQGKTFAVVPQDSPEDIAECVRAIVSTRPGQRDDLPNLGVRSPAFRQRVDLDEVERQIAEYEPRASVLAEEHRDLLNDALAVVEVRVDG